MSRTTHHAGTLSVEIWRHLCPYCDRWHVHEDNGEYDAVRLPEEAGDHWGEETSQAGELVIHHASTITADTSGDRDTPNGDDDIETSLDYAEINGQRLPQALAEEVFELFRDRIETQVSERNL